MATEREVRFGDTRFYYLKFMFGSMRFPSMELSADSKKTIMLSFRKLLNTREVCGL